MTDKELRKLSRAELLQMLITQIEENKKMQDRLSEVESKLQDRQICIDNVGSLAEASMSLNGVFQAAEAAAQQYLENIRSMNSQQEFVCKDMQTKAEKRASEIILEAQTYSQKMHAEADEYWKQVRVRAANVLQSQDALRELVLSGGKNEEEKD